MAGIYHYHIFFIPLIYLLINSELINAHSTLVVHFRFEFWLLCSTTMINSKIRVKNNSLKQWFFFFLLFPIFSSLFFFSTSRLWNFIYLQSGYINSQMNTLWKDKGRKVALLCVFWSNLCQAHQTKSINFNVKRHDFTLHWLLFSIYNIIYNIIPFFLFSFFPPRLYCFTVFFIS